MSLHVKQAFISALVQLLKFAVIVKRGVFLFARFLVFPLKLLARLVFYTLLVHLYRAYRRMKIAIRARLAPSHHLILAAASTKYLVHLVIVFLSVGIAASNIHAREVRAENVGSKSLIFGMLGQGDEDIIETADGAIARPVSYLDRAGTVAGIASAAELTDSEVEAGVSLTQGASTLVKPSIPTTDVSVRPREDVAYHVVEGGETVSQIAEQYNLNTATLLWENKLTVASLIQPGEKLTILPADGVSHQVKSGDTIDKIASRYQVTAEAILDYNELASANLISAGDVLIVPGGVMPEPTPVPTPKRSIGTLFADAGDAPAANRSGGSGFLWPTPSHKINQYFRSRHTGVDIDGDYSSPVWAAADGRVEFVGWGAGYGLEVVINHGDGTKTLYGHHSKLFVQAGQQVKRGDTIGMVGCTGWCTGTHVHFEVIIGGRKVNPLSYL